MRADRLLSILMLLQVHRRMTTREIAERLEVSERTVHRDMEALASAGIPLYAERGNGGGWRLPEGYRTNLTGLTRTEIRSLFVPGASAARLTELGLGEAAESAQRKLFAALPAGSLPDAEFTRQRIYVDGAGWYDAAESVPLLPLLQEAVWQEKRLRIDYRRRDEEHKRAERVVEPLGLVAKGTAWYLVAAGAEGELRSFRVSRIAAAEVLEETFDRPAGFELEQYWKRWIAEFKEKLPSYKAVLFVNKAVLRRLRYARYVTVLEVSDKADPEGRIRVVADLETKEYAEELLLGFGASVRVAAPEELKASITEAVRELAELYGTTGDKGGENKDV
ncbi:YafY family protein [Paenibacillus sp. GD4]|jgi:predicted DNA-binding transcriptional regulator YafY|uniref:helix-turn-helix transcriptional regulator n=1 Tax=Paenibacillus sp. GD4 TaxID=3068890 RepID=UPI0027969FD5|nr:YafY family protein [Paenibacillus sp. GD4]MDQ1912271.1 YafY family protein [Paenibacillus sp. GD4]